VITLGAGATAILLGAGVVAGVVGSAGGITSLVSYPALLAVGLPAVSANVANIVALVCCWPGSALSSQPELSGRGPWLWRFTPVAAAGGAAGAALLLATPAAAFARVVPFLVAGASVALLIEPRLARRRRERRARDGTLALPGGVLTLSVYNGYFGAGSGVMLLTLLLLLVDRHLPRANALKNMLLGAGTLASSIILIVSGSVRWSAVVPLGIGMLAGSSVGPHVTRRLPAGILRPAIALLGIGLAVALWVRPGL
jgi:uncharacterized membrane protein YfcA